MPDDHAQADAPAHADPKPPIDAPIAFVLSVLQALSEMATLETRPDDATTGDARNAGGSAGRPTTDPKPADPVTPGGPVEAGFEAISLRQGIRRAEVAGPVGAATTGPLPPDSSWSSWSVTALERAVARLGIAVPCLVAPPARFH